MMSVASDSSAAGFGQINLFEPLDGDMVVCPAVIGDNSRL
jgi:hypothetical protein